MQYRSSYHRPKKKIAKYFLFAVIGIVVGSGFIAYPKIQAYMDRIALDQQNADTMSAILQNNIVEKTIVNIQNIEPKQVEEKKVIILESAYLEVPFVCQAPLQTEANWVHHEESCEEAALLQVHYYLEGVEVPNKNTANEVILDMIKWQNENFGEHKDLYANDMKDFITGYYNYEKGDIEIIYDADVVDIKRAISAGYPVIVPIMGDLLRNPYYPYPGYHMLTVIGYTPEKIVTNDVGTRRGEDFSYEYDRFQKAMDAAGGDIIIIHKSPNSDDEET